MVNSHTCTAAQNQFRSNRLTANPKLINLVDAKGTLQDPQILKPNAQSCSYFEFLFLGHYHRETYFWSLESFTINKKSS